MQLAHVSHGILVVEAHLDRQLLGVERPSLAVSRVVGELAIKRQSLDLPGQRALEVMAGHGLVIGEGRHEPAGDLGRVAQVDPVEAWPGAIQRRVLVIAGWRSGLDRLWHAFDQH